MSERPPTRVTNGIIVLLDALGARAFDLGRCCDYIRDRDQAWREAKERAPLHPSGDEIGISMDLEPVMFTFGDTVLLAWDFSDCETRSVVAPSFVANRLTSFIEASLRRGILFRRAIAAGAYVIDQTTHTVIGPAVADAASWYEEIDWFGVVATPSCGIAVDYFREIKENAKNSDTVRENYLKYLNSIGGVGLDVSILEEVYSRCLAWISTDQG